MRAIRVIILTLFSVLLLLSCSVNKRDALSKTVNDYFTAKKEDDLNKMYDFINPTSKKRISKESFITQQTRYASSLIGKDFLIKSITFTDDNNATVEVDFIVAGQEVNTQFPFIYEEGGWYRKYPMYETDK